MTEANTASENAKANDTAPQEGMNQSLEGQQEVPYELTPEKMMLDNLFILGMLFFIFYFILIRPQQKRLKIQQAMLKALEKGNKIISTGGLIGTITKFEGDDIVVVEIAQGIKVRMARSAVSEVMSDKSPGESANDN
jgi:preprotein translocase subunit YajC